MGDKQTGLEREAMSIRGVRSELRLEGGQIHITKDATTQARPTSVTIEVRQVRGATIEVPRRGGRGWLHIATVNGSPAPVGELAASGDPFALPITKGQVGACRRLAKLVDRHVKERGLPADVGPNQGRYTSGVVVSSVSKPVHAPMVTVPEPSAPRSEEPVVEVSPRPAGEAPDAGKPVARKATEMEATAKKAATKKAAAKKAVAKKAVAKKAVAKKAVAKKAVAKKAVAKEASARAASRSELVAQLRELGELHAAGVLDDAEFAAAKAKLLS